MEKIFSVAYKFHEIAVFNNGSQLVTQLFRNGGPVSGFNLPSSNEQLGPPPYFEDNFEREIEISKQYIDATVAKDKKFLVTYRYYKDDVYVTDTFSYANDEMLADEEIRRLIFTWRVNALNDRSNIQINSQRPMTADEIEQLGL